MTEDRWVTVRQEELLHRIYIINPRPSNIKLCFQTVSSEVMDHL